METRNFSRFFMVFALLIVAIMTGCATGQGPAPQYTSSSGLSAGNMKLSARMSSSIFLQPVSPAKRVVYVYGHNTSSAQGLRFAEVIKKDLQSKGYRITDDPAKAQYMLMYNVLYVGKQDQNHTADGVLAGGFGGAVISSLISPHTTPTVVGGIAGAVIGGIIGSIYHHDHYMMAVDVQLEQRQAGTETEVNTQARQGTASTLHTYHSGIKGWMVYRDRAVAQASGTNLSFDYATPAMIKEVSGELAGLF